jgi:hypothetical protein
MGKVRNEENKIRQSVMSTFNLTEIKQQNYDSNGGPGGRAQQGNGNGVASPK